MTSILKYVYIDKLRKPVNKYSNHIITQLKWILLVLCQAHTLSLVEKKEKYSKFKGSNHGRISTYKNSFAKITF